MHDRYLAFKRDAKGLPITVTDEQGHATEITSPDGSKKRFGYSNGMLTSLKNGALAEERYTYDKTGRVLTSESEGGVNRLEHYYGSSPYRVGDFTWFHIGSSVQVRTFSRK